MDIMDFSLQELEVTLHLSKEELDTALWKKIEPHFKNQLNMARRQNDHMNTAEETNRLRGRISAYKEFLQLNPGNEDI